MIVYYHESFSIKQLLANWKRKKGFWKSVGFTILGLGIGFVLNILFSEIFFKGIDDGMFNLCADGWIGVLLLTCSTIIMPPLAEELYFRQGMIRDSSKVVLITTSIVSILLYSAEHSLSWFGILESVFIAIPFMIAFIKTKNVYVVITAHFILNIIGNFPSVIIMSMRLMK